MGSAVLYRENGGGLCSLENVMSPCNVTHWNQMIISPMRVRGELEGKHVVNFTGTHLVCKNEVRVCAVMLW